MHYWLFVQLFMWRSLDPYFLVFLFPLFLFLRSSLVGSFANWFLWVIDYLFVLMLRTVFISISVAIIPVLVFVISAPIKHQLSMFKVNLLRVHLCVEVVRFNKKYRTKELRWMIRKTRAEGYFRVLLYLL